MPIKKISLLGLALLLAALDSQALTLGRIRGAALIGQGLDVSIQVQTDPDEGSSNQCFEAEVFHADARQDPSRVQLSIEPTQAPQIVNVRIQSSAAVDEPVVTVYLRAGCSQKTSRRYVMLADVLSEPAAPPVARSPQQLPLVVPATAAAVPAGAGGAVAVDRGTTASAGRSAAVPAVRSKPLAKAPPKAAVAAAPTRKPAPAKAVAPSPAAAAGTAEKLVAGRAAGQSRLKLDPLEVLSERVSTLESSTASAPAEQAAREVRDAQRLESLESSVKNLLAVATRNEASLADLRVRLQQAESDRYANALVYSLAALLLVALAGLAFLLTRRGSSGAGGGNWWSGASNIQQAAGSVDIGHGEGPRRSGFAPMSAPAPLSVPDSLPAADHTQHQAERVGPPSKAAPITQVDVNLVEMSESTFDRLMQSGSAHSAVRKPAPEVEGAFSAEPVRRLIDTDGLFDIRQQAEFFVSLGQTDQAVRVLENRIAESGETSPLAYLDLLKIFHSLGLKADFRQVREDFNLLFNARLPEFASFDSEGRDLESYPAIVDRLIAVWGRPEILPAIEYWLFREPANTQRDVLDLAAFRDLLLVHAVAQSVQLLPDRLYVPAGSSLPRSPFGNAARGEVQTPASQVAPIAADAGLDNALPVLPGQQEVDIDLPDLSFDLSFDPPVPDTPLSQGDSARGTAVPADAGNLIDFDLPTLPGTTGRPGGR